jgi:hypothetical protein
MCSVPELKELYRHYHFRYLFADFISITAMTAKSIKVLATDLPTSFDSHWSSLQFIFSGTFRTALLHNPLSLSRLWRVYIKTKRISAKTEECKMPPHWYKNTRQPEGCRIESLWGDSILQLVPSFQLCCEPGFDSPYNRNQCQESPWGLKAVGAWGWHIHRHLLADCLDNVGASMSHNIMGLSRSVTGIALLYGDGVCFLWGINWTVSTATSSQYLAVNCEPIV